MTDNTSAENLKILRSMTLEALTDIELVSYDQLTARLGVSHLRRYQLEEDYPGIVWNVHLWLDGNQAEQERRHKKAKAKAAAASAATEPAKRPPWFNQTPNRSQRPSSPASTDHAALAPAQKGDVDDE